MMELGPAIQAAFQDDRAWKILVEDSCVKAGPFDGGCLVVANAILQAAGHGALVRIASDLNGAEHYGAAVDGLVYDGAGGHASPDAWLTHLVQHELVSGRRLTYAEGLDAAATEIVADPAAERALSNLLQAKLARVPGTTDLAALRAFLTSRWIEWGQANHKPVTARGEGMCRFSAYFLKLALGNGWRFSGGVPDVFDWPSRKWIDRPDGGGYFDGCAWQAHHWVTDGKTIIDMTASQFGERDIMIVPATDPRFHETISTQRERAEAARDVETRARQWHKDWVATLPKDALSGQRRLAL